MDGCGIGAGIKKAGAYLGLPGVRACMYARSFFMLSVGNMLMFLRPIGSKMCFWK
jgi:hypothetical protein